MCFFRSPKVVIPKPAVDPEVEARKAEMEAKNIAEKKKQDDYKAKLYAGKVGRRSLTTGESGGQGYLS